MRHAIKLAVAIASCFLVLAGALVDLAPPAGANSPKRAATAPQQLVHAYPLGPQRLCCGGQGRSRSTASSSQRRAQPVGRSPGSTSPAGSSALIWIVLGAVAALLLAATGNTVIYRKQRRRLPGRVAPAGGNATAESPSGAAKARPAYSGIGPPSPAAADDSAQREDSLRAAATELAYRRADEGGDAAAAFNLGVLLHERGDFAGAAAAYMRAEQRGDRDAAFNLGVLLYEAGDLDAAEAAWRRCASYGHAKAAANLWFLLQRHRAEEEQFAGTDADRSAVGEDAQTTVDVPHTDFDHASATPRVADPSHRP